MLCSLSLYKAIKKKNPDSHITLVASKTNYEIPFFDINPFIDRVLIYDKSSSKSVFDFYKRLRDRKYDFGFVPSTIKISRTSHIINFLSGAKIRVGVNSIDGIKNKSAFLLNLKGDFNWENKHQLFRNLEIAQLAGFNLGTNEINEIKISLKEEEIEFAKNFLLENFPDKSKKIIAFHPGAGKKQNIWPTDFFLELIVKLNNEFAPYILLTYGNLDKDIIDYLITKLEQKMIPYVLLNNKISIKQQSAILNFVHLYVTNDTGSMHIAGSGRAKMISLFGPTKPDEWCPIYDKSYYIKSSTNKIEDIKVEQVYKLVKEILEG
jgi:ADP-heptose:LPS heptosyltransferase